MRLTTSALLSAWLPGLALAAQGVATGSPDGTMQVVVDVDVSRPPVHTVRLDDTPVMLESRLGLRFRESRDLVAGFRVDGVLGLNLAPGGCAAVRLGPADGGPQ